MRHMGTDALPPCMPPSPTSCPLQPWLRISSLQATHMRLSTTMMQSSCLGPSCKL